MERLRIVRYVVYGDMQCSVSWILFTSRPQIGEKEMLASGKPIVAIFNTIIQFKFNEIQFQFNEIQVQFNEIQLQCNEIQFKHPGLNIRESVSKSFSRHF